MNANTRRYIVLTTADGSRFATYDLGRNRASLVNDPNHAYAYETMADADNAADAFSAMLGEFVHGVEVYL